MSCQTLGCKAQAVAHGEYCKTHTCRKQSCRRELTNGGKGGSRHCELHGCQVDGCPEAHVQGSSWCDKHVCSYERCLSQRMAMIGTEHEDVIQDAGTWYKAWVPQWWAVSGNAEKDDGHIESCKGHRCEVDACPKVRKQGSTSCRQHVCQYRSCLSLGQEENGVCINHTCNAEDCSEVQARNRPFCATHACHGTGCHVQSIPGSESCADHRCSFAGGCNRAAQHDNDVCEDHECRVESCHRPVGGVDWEHCKAHVCRTDECTARKAPGSVYCEGCKCADPECGALKNPHSEYCVTHSCRTPRCTNPPDDDAPFCTDHKCRNPGCLRANSPGHSSYCSHHRCRYGRDDGSECPRGRWVVETQEEPEEEGRLLLPQPPQHHHHLVLHGARHLDDDAGSGSTRHRSGPMVIRSRFCEKHSCKVIGCPEVRRKGAGYCAAHACGWVASNGKVCTREGGHWGFCDRHGCGIDGCPEIVCAEGYGFCDEHSCQGVVEMEGEPHPVRCQEPAPITGDGGGGGFCDEHTCDSPGCPEPIDTVNSTARYCASHLCSWDRGCERVRAVPMAEGGFFCAVHECEMTGCTAGRRPTGEALCAFHWKEDVERVRRSKEMATASPGYPPALPEPRYTVPMLTGYVTPPLPVGASASAWRGNGGGGGRASPYEDYDVQPQQLALPSTMPVHEHMVAHSPHARGLVHSHSRNFSQHQHPAQHPHAGHAHPAHAHPMAHPHAHPHQYALPPPAWDTDDEADYVWDESRDVVDDEWVPRGGNGTGATNNRLLLEYNNAPGGIAHLTRERSDSYTRERPKGYGRERSDSHGQDHRERERVMHMQTAAQQGGRNPRRSSEGYSARAREMVATSWG